MDFRDYGRVPDAAERDGRGLPARVTSVYKERYGLVSERGESFGRLKASEYYHICSEEFPTAGDFVLVEPVEGGDDRILATLPRRTVFTRKNPTLGLGEQAVAANFDRVFIMQSMNRDFNVRRLERYMTLAKQSRAVPVVVLTKLDLARNRDEYVLAAEAVSAGAEVCAVSALTGEGLDALAPHLGAGMTAVFLGSSGVGKSSLVNALAGEAVMDVGCIREDDARGRHTTTSRHLIMLKSGAMVIDTPGMRELGLWDVTDGLDSAFADVESKLGRCRFSDCTHTGEPGCAILAAIAAGELSRERFESYSKLRAEAEFAENRAEALRKKKQWHMQIAKTNRLNRKREE